MPANSLYVMAVTLKSFGCRSDLGGRGVANGTPTSGDERASCTAALPAGEQEKGSAHVAAAPVVPGSVPPGGAAEDDGREHGRGILRNFSSRVGQTMRILTRRRLWVLSARHRHLESFRMKLTRRVSGLRERRAGPCRSTENEPKDSLVPSRPPDFLPDTQEKA